MKGTAIEMTPYEISTAMRRHGGCYFIGEACGKCNVRVNTFGSTAYGPAGWFCPNPDCDHYNVQCWHGGMMPWDAPDYGPTKRTIRQGGKLSERDTRRSRKFADGQKVFVNLHGGSPPHICGADWRAGRIINMREDSYFFAGMRHYNVLLSDGRERMVYEDYICKSSGWQLVVRRGNAEMEPVQYEVVELTRN